MDEAIRLSPHFKPYTNRGAAYSYLRQHQHAIADFDEAIRLNPQFAAGYENRAQAYTFLGKDEEAQQDVERAVGLGIDRGLLEGTI